MAAELFVGALVSAFLNPLVESLASRVKGLFGEDQEEVILKLVEDLKTKKPSADLLLSLAEEKLVTDHAVRQWLDDLKDNIYRADDSLYMIETEPLRRKKTNMALQCFSSSTSSNQISMLEETLRKLNSCLENEGLHRERLNQMNLERHYLPSLEQDEVYGRNADKEEVIESLVREDMANDGCSFSVISLVGMGGIGKTTFAEFVYNDERIRSTFDCKVWITVGDDKLDCSKVMKSIVEKITSQPCQTNELRDLQEEVKKTLIGKKFLFVLDDVWDEDRSKWNLLSHSFKSGPPGSKIIVTTRSYKVARIMTPGSFYKLNALSETDGLQLFVEQTHVNINEHSYLQDIAKEIVGKCKGLPLAIKSIGCLLRGNHNKEEWSKIFNSPIWELYKREKVHILPALWLSYLYLPSPIKQCFAYCSIFPKDHSFDKEDMIMLWMAEGYLHSENEKSPQEVGEEYFDNLISKSFFQLSSNLDSFSYVMHDLIHDLAIFISGEFCVTKYDKMCSLKKVRHVRYGPPYEEDVQLENFQNLSKAKCFLRTLLLEHEALGWLSKIKELHQSFPHLRVLSIKSYKLTKIPASLPKYLTYLKLNLKWIRAIPNTVCSLYNLETLLLEGCPSITQLPTDIGNLEKLRHLLVPKSLEKMPLQFGKLRNLERLNRFVVGRMKGCGGIELLKNVPDLGGHLYIDGLGIVNSLEEESHVILKSKKFLSKLSLDWADRHDSRRHREILSALEPHPNLKELNIYGYSGTSFPSWLGDSLTSLKTLKLSKCCNCSTMPSLGQLPSLKQLEITYFTSVVRIDSNFYYSTGVDSSVVIQRKPFGSLERLRICFLSKLEEWSFIEGGDFPCLKELIFSHCPQLKLSLLSYHFPSLRKLKIHYCKQLLAPSVLPMHSPFPSLEILEISDCGGEKLLLVEGGFPSSLKHISIWECQDLKDFHEWAFQRLTSLEKLSIWNCRNLGRLPKLPTSLSHLNVGVCDLVTRRLQRETGEDWPNIAHIPNISINVREDRTPRLKCWYTISKTLAEQAAWKFAKEIGMDLVTIHPGFVIGPLLQPNNKTSAKLLLNQINGSQICSQIEC